MGAINPTREQIRVLGETDPGDFPIVMLNLLRFRERAEYPEGSEAKPCSGREAYSRYAEKTLAVLEGLGGRIVWSGSALATVIGPNGEGWDEVALVEYPSRKAFLELAATVESSKATEHRTAGLEDTRLIAVVEGKFMPGAG